MNALTEITSALLELEQEVMMPVWMSNALATVGIGVGIVPFMRALYKARDRHERVIDAANDAETWADAYDIQNEMDHHPDRFTKYGDL